MSVLLEINPDNPQKNRLEQVVSILKKDGVIIYPTDTVYGLGCSLFSKKAIQKLCLIKSIKPNKLNLSFICKDLSEASEYVKRIDNTLHKTLKKALPGPFTFILEASSHVPKVLDIKKNQVGIRMPDHNIPLTLVEMLGNPIITTSIKDEDDIVEYSTDPSLIFEKYEKVVDLVIDGGYGNNIGSTVVLYENGEFEIVREGLGNLEQFL